jgi:hypothetical protein
MSLYSFKYSLVRVEQAAGEHFVSGIRDFIGDLIGSVKWSGFFGQVCGSPKMHPGEVSCRLAHLYRIKVCVVGRSFIKSCMGSLSVVKSDPIVDDTFCLYPVLQFVQVDSFLLQGSPEAFDEDVVEVSSPPIHRIFDLGIGQGGDPGRTSELRSLVRIHYLWLAISGDCLLQRLNAKAGIQRVGEPPEL